MHTDDSDRDALTCRPPFAHIFLNGSSRCVCGAEDDSVLIEIITASELLGVE